MSRESKPIYGLMTGFLDFPGRYAVTLYLTGCNVCCPWCHNRDVVMGKGNISASQAEAFIKPLATSFLGGLGVVFSGGEPTSNPHFRSLVERFGNLPLGIHTNGLVLPEWPTGFESVVLSLKSPTVVDMTTGEYLMKVQDAIRYYSPCKRRQIRYVADTVPLDIVSAAHSIAETLAPGEWEFECVPDSTIKGVFI